MAEFFSWLKYMSDKDPATLALIVVLAVIVLLMAGVGLALAYLKLQETRTKQQGQRETNIFETVNSMAGNITRLIDQNAAFESRFSVLSKSMSDLAALESQRMESRIKESTAQQQAQIDLAKSIFAISNQYRDLKDQIIALKDLIQEANKSHADNRHTDSNPAN